MAAGDETPDLLEWFRLDRAGGTRWLLGLGSLGVFLGAGLLGGAFLTHTTEALRNVSTVGGALLLFGLFTAFGGMALLLANDDYLAVRADGILLHRASGDVLVTWESLRKVRADARALVLERREEDASETTETTMRIEERYTGATRVELAAHLEALRRKASMAELTFDTVKAIAIGLPHVRPGSVKGWLP
jgi:head-tail adaptor